MNTPKTIFEDTDFIVAEKPAGLVTYDVKGTEPSLAEFYKDKIAPDLLAQMADRGGLVHRLDKDTSGLILIAKNEATLINLQSQFKEHTVKKEYVAVVHGKVEKGGTIKLPIGRQNIGKMTISAAKTKEAETSFEITKYIGENTLLRVNPKTGRTHQIRVHLKSIGHPVVGDKLYGLPDKAIRMMLHATKITFAHPRSGHKLTFESPTPTEFFAD